MIRSLSVPLAVILVAVMASTGLAQTPPDDSAKYHVITVTAPVSTVAGENLLRSMETDPVLARIIAKCKRFQFVTTDPLYQQRYATALPPVNLPIVALVRSDGGVIYKSSGANVLAGRALADKLTEQALADRRANPRTIAPSMPLPQLEAEDCPTCPSQPRQPLLQPDRPRRPLVSPIPDTVNINPSGSLNVGIPESAGYAAVAVAVLAVIGMLGFVAVAGLFAFALYVFVRN